MALHAAQRNRSGEDEPWREQRYRGSVTEEGEPTGAVTSRAAVIATLLLFAAIVAVVLMVTLWDSGERGSAAPAASEDPDAVEPVTAPPIALGAVRTGSTAPDFTLTSLTGETVSLSDYAGRPVMINFWASWCPPCRAEFPLLAGVRERYQDQGLEILGVTVNDGASYAQDFVDKIGAEWPILLDSDAVAWEAYGGVGLPTSFFVDAAGVVRDARIGPVNEVQLSKHLAAIGIRPG